MKHEMQGGERENGEQARRTGTKDVEKQETAKEGGRTLARTTKNIPSSS